MQTAPSLIYFHGFRSSPMTEKGQAFQCTFPGITLAAYDTLHPDIGYWQLDRIVREALPRRAILIGSSLGGFWACQLAKQYALPCVLLNPCLSPELTLAPYVGEVENLYTGERGMMEESDLQAYGHYRQLGEAAQCVVLHEKGDELIPFQESVVNFEGKARLILIEGGSHRFEHLDIAIGEIEALMSGLQAVE